MATDDTATRVLNAAGPIFADKGFEKATVRDIVQAAGVNLASVNYHFRDKERLYIETVKRAAQLREEQVPMPQMRDGTPPAEKLRIFIHTILTRMLGVGQTPWQVRLMLREILQPTSACKELAEQYFRRHFEMLLAILRDVLPPDTPEHRVHLVGDSIIGQCLHQRVARQVIAMLVPPGDLERHYTTDALAEHITEFSLAALGLGPPLNTPRA